MRFATYSANGTTHYGAITEDGAIALDDAFPQWPSLFDAIAADGLTELESAASDQAITQKTFDY